MCLWSQLLGNVRWEGLLGAEVGDLEASLGSIAWTHLRNRQTGNSNNTLHCNSPVWQHACPCLRCDWSSSGQFSSLWKQMELSQNVGETFSHPSLPFRVWFQRSHQSSSSEKWVGGLLYLHLRVIARVKCTHRGKGPTLPVCYGYWLFSFEKIGGQSFCWVHGWILLRGETHFQQLRTKQN